MKVCIEDKPDGTFLVSNEAQEESAEGQPPAGSPPAASAPASPAASGEVANSLDEALQLAGRMFKAKPGGMMPSPFEQGMKQGLNPGQPGQ